MTGAMLTKLMKMCSANWNSYGEDLTFKGVQWAKTFEKIPDDLMETAIISCINYCTKFPTIADIKQSIRDLQYEEQTKPKQLEHRTNWHEPLATKAFKMVADRQAKKFIQDVSIGDLVEYARLYFPEISEETVRKNLPEFYQGQESQDACFACRLNSVGDCYNKGFTIKHWMEPDGRIKNEMLKCQKNMKN